MNTLVRSPRVSFRALNRTFVVELTQVGEPEAAPRTRTAARAVRASAALGGVPRSVESLIAKSAFMQQRFPNQGPRIARVAPVQSPGPRASAAVEPQSSVVTLATASLIVEGARRADMAAAINRGARILHEGWDGKVLLQCDTIEQAFGIANLLQERRVGSATPNFVRLVQRAPRASGGENWAHKLLRVQEAWHITRGRSEIKVAVLDEGVDSGHPALAAAIVAQKDFIGPNGNSAVPSGDDAHGTACAGIVASQDSESPGIAPGCTLIAARIGMGDGHGSWIFDDYATADAIDWCWREGAAVLSNSWGGGLPSDAIARAFGRARTQGRGGLGSVVVIAAGNDQIPIDFPGELPGYVTVGASNQKDERKTKSSSDGENWGSNFGSTLWIMAPGVSITTTDISGPSGYGPDDFVTDFNGTSSATPHVAAAAALMLAARPMLAASQVRDLLKSTAKPLKGQTGWNRENGWGRLDVAAAVRAAAGAPAHGASLVGGEPSPALDAPARKKAKKVRKINSSASSASTRKARKKRAVGK